MQPRPMRANSNTFRKFRAMETSDATPECPALLQSQRDCVLQPRVARHELPWVAVSGVINPNGVVSGATGRAATPLGLCAFDPISQGSSCLAAPGFAPESLWDSSTEFPKGISTSPKNFQCGETADPAAQIACLPVSARIFAARANSWSAARRPLPGYTLNSDPLTRHA